MLPIALMYAALPLASWLPDETSSSTTSSVPLHGFAPLSTTQELKHLVVQSTLSAPETRKSAAAARSITSSFHSESPSLAPSPSPRPSSLLLCLIYLPHILVFLYFALLHQRAPLSTIAFVRSEGERLLRDPAASGLGSADS